MIVLNIPQDLHLRNVSPDAEVTYVMPKSPNHTEVSRSQGTGRFQSTLDLENEAKDTKRKRQIASVCASLLTLYFESN